MCICCSVSTNLVYSRMHQCIREYTKLLVYSRLHWCKYESLITNFIRTYTGASTNYLLLVIVSHLISKIEESTRGCLRPL